MPKPRDQPKLTGSMRQVGLRPMRFAQSIARSLGREMTLLWVTGYRQSPRGSVLSACEGSQPTHRVKPERLPWTIATPTPTMILPACRRKRTRATIGPTAQVLPRLAVHGCQAVPETIAKNRLPWIIPNGSRSSGSCYHPGHSDLRSWHGTSPRHCPPPATRHLTDQGPVGIHPERIERPAIWRTWR